MISAVSRKLPIWFILMDRSCRITLVAKATTADLVYLDGPFLSHYVSGKGDDYLFYWVDRDDKDNRWLVLRVSLSSLQKYIGKELTLLELIENPNDGYLYSVDVDNDLNYHNIKLIQPSAV